MMTAYVMIDMKGERPRRRGEAVLMRADIEATVTWVKRCRGGRKKQARVWSLMRIMGALEARAGWCSQGRYVRGVDIRLADGLTRWQERKILEKLNAECPGIGWQVQELGTGSSSVFVCITRGYAFVGVTASTRRTYEANWRMLVSYWSYIGKGCWLRKYMEEIELVG